jgi:hypothetical protein
MSEQPLPGPLDDFLANPPGSPPSIELQREILRRTSQMVRQRRRRRWLLATASLAAASLLLGIGIWALTRPGPEIEPAPGGPLSAAIVARAKPGSGPPDDVTPKSPPAINSVPPSPVALEWKAFDAPPEMQWVLYREAGDRYFEDAADFASALRCYKLAFQRAPMSGLAIDRTDNWMVTALKRDQMERRKEN